MVPSSKQDKTDPGVILNLFFIHAFHLTSHQISSLSLWVPHIRLLCLSPQALDIAHLDCNGSILTGLLALLLFFSNTSSVLMLKWPFWSTTLSMLFSCLKQLSGSPTYGINPNGPLCCTNALMIGSLASFAASSLISPRYLGYTSLFLPRSHGFILPCLSLYLEFLLDHPNPPHSLGELFIL